tara:strand:+ start:1466 stop:2074 length:609 start_codon:yes stop_codon:yes gene_type:complete
MFNLAINDMTLLVSKLSIFIFIIAGNFSSDIFSCGLRQFLDRYMIIKHIIGFFIMLFFVGLLLEEANFITKIIESIILYIWFILIMRSPTIITICVLICICIIYLLSLYKKDLELKLEKNEENNDEISKNIDFITQISNSLFIISFLITIIGMISYLIILKNNDKANFSIINFLLGKKYKECFSRNINNRFKKNNIFYDIKK